MTSPVPRFVATVLRSAMVVSVIQAAALLVCPGAPDLLCGTASAQGCSGCVGSLKAMQDAEAAHAACPEGREAACYQALLASRNLYSSCVSRGCDTGPQGGDPSDSGGSEDTGSTANEQTPPDRDADGVPDADDRCPTTPAGVTVDSRGCPPMLLVTVSTPVTKDAGEEILSQAPGTTMTVSGTVKDAAGSPVPGAMIEIELVGTEVSALAGTMVGTSYYEVSLDLPLDIPNGRHTVRASATKPGYSDGTAETSFEVAGASLWIDFRPPRDIPLDTTTRWEISVQDEDRRNMRDAQMRIVATHQDSGATIVESGPTSTDWHSTYAPNPWFTWETTWTEEQAGEWVVRVSAEKEGFEAATLERRFTVGAHTVLLANEIDDVRCWPWCRPQCRYRTAIIDHDIHNNTPCWIPAKCTLGHDLRYEWTADGGTINYPGSKGITWRPPQTPGHYTIRGTAICTEDPEVKTSFEEKIEATTRELFWKSATQGRIEMRGFDRVKVEKISGEFKDADFTGNAGAYTDDWDELEEGRWLEGERWELMAGLETTITLGVYRDGKRVGEITVGEMQSYSVKRLRRSTHGWLPSAQTSPYLIFVDIVPDRRYEAIDFSVTTGTETSSVRGTTFFVAFDDEKSSVVGTLEGEVAVTPRLVPGPVTVVSRRQWVSVDGNGVSDVAPMTEAQADQVLAEFPEVDIAGHRTVSEPHSQPAGDSAVVVYSEDFSGDEAEILARWDTDDEDVLWVEVSDGVLVLEPSDWGAEIWTHVPLENICVEFEGWVEDDGFSVLFADALGNELTASMSGGEGGAIGLEDGTGLIGAAQIFTFVPGSWSDFRFCLRDGLVEGWVDGEDLVSAPAPSWLRNTGTLTFHCWGWPVKIDNLEISQYR